MKLTKDWWRGAVIYQIYPRSYQDTTGDGMGDLMGIAQRLPYVASLGVVGQVDVLGLGQDLHRVLGGERFGKTLHGDRTGQLEERLLGVSWTPMPRWACPT